MSNYAKAYKEFLKQGVSIEELNNANHIALETNKITMKEFSEVAQILVKAFLER